MSAGRKARRAFEKRARREEKPRAVFSVTMMPDGRIAESAHVMPQDGRAMLGAIRKLLGEFERRIAEYEERVKQHQAYVGGSPQTAAAKYFAKADAPAEETTA